MTSTPSGSTPPGRLGQALVSDRRNVSGSRPAITDEHITPDTPSRMRLVVCDDHRAFVEALATVLAQRGHSVVATADTPARAIAACQQHRPDMCLMDLGFPDADGLDGVAALAHDGITVLVLTAQLDGAVVRDAFGAGAGGVVSKASSLDLLLTGIERVAAGEQYCDATLLRRVLGPQGRRDPAARLAGYLTRREREVLERMVRGESTAAMCAAMGVSVTTVRSHVQAVLSKLNVNSRLAAVAFATAHRIVSLPPGAQAKSG